jgi:hypothetical protein
MRRSRAGALVLLLGLLGGLGWQLKVRHELEAEVTRLREERARLTEDLGTLRDELATLDARGRYLEQRLRELPAYLAKARTRPGEAPLPAQRAGEAAAVEATAAPAPASSEDAVAAETPTPAALGERFAAESVDPRWAAEAAQRAREALVPFIERDREGEGHAELQALDCRSSLCRVEIRQGEADAGHNVTEQAFIHPATRIWSGPVTTTSSRDEQGRLVTIAFHGRE